MKEKTKINKIMKKSLFTTAVVGAMLIAPYVAEEMNIKTSEQTASAYSGEGTYSNPYIVSSANDLVQVGSLIASNATTEAKKGYVKLNADIDMTGVNWTPIGTSTKPVYVGFDGNGHTIKNLTYSTTSDYVGLFANVKDSSFSNLTFDSPNMRGGSYTGVLTGKAVGTDFRNIKFNNPTVYSTKKYVGSLFGSATDIQGMEKIRVYNGNFFAETGYIGAIGGDGSSKESYASAGGIYSDSIVKTNGQYAGGLFGVIELTLTTNSWNLYGLAADGTVAGKSYVGGLFGKSNNINVNGFASNGVTGTDSSAYVGGITGYVSGAESRLFSIAMNAYINAPSATNKGAIYGKAGTTSLTNIPMGLAYDDFGGHRTARESTMKRGEKLFDVAKRELPAYGGDRNFFWRGKSIYFNFESKSLIMGYISPKENKFLMYEQGTPEDIRDSYENYLLPAIDEAWNTVDKPLMFSTGYYKKTLVSDVFVRDSEGMYLINAYEKSFKQYLSPEGVKAFETYQSRVGLVVALENYFNKSTSRYKYDSISHIESMVHVLRNEETKELYKRGIEGESYDTAMNDTINNFISLHQNGKYYTLTSDDTELFNLFQTWKQNPSSSLVNSFTKKAKKILATNTLIHRTTSIEFMAEVMGASLDGELEVDENEEIAIAAVEKAEKSLLLEDVKSARILVEKVIDSDVKESLNVRLDKVEAYLEAVQKLTEATTAVEQAESKKSQETVNVAREKVNMLPEGKERATLTARLDTVQAEIDKAKADAEALKRAIDLVEKAESSKSQDDLNVAKDLVNALPETQEKADLTARLDTVQAKIDEAKANVEALKRAIDSVEKAESSKSQADVDTAREKVNMLPDSEDKVELTSRLDVVQTEIDKNEAGTVALAKATESVEKAESTKKQADVDKAREKVNALPESQEKANLTTRLEAVQKEIDKANSEAEIEKLVKEATETVKKAESTKKQADVNEAREKVSILPDSEEKADLTARLDAVQAEIDKEKTDTQKLVEATKAVEHAESTKTQVDVDEARKQVNALSDSKEKSALIARLDNVQAAIDKVESGGETLAKATEAVEKAESTKSQADLNDARKLVNALPNGKEKDSLKTRLDAVQKAISEENASNKLQELIDKAEKAVVNAENNPTLFNILNASSAVGHLPEGEVKTALKERIDAINKGLEEAQKEKEAIKQADKLVKNAERTRIAVDIEKAQKAVTALKESVDKTDLQKRIDSIDVRDEAFEAALKAVENLEKFPSKGNVTSAEKALSVVYDEKKMKNLQERIELVKGHIQASLLKDATKYVERAESEKTTKSIADAQNKVDELYDDESKAALVLRLNAIQSVLEDKKEDYSSYVVDKNVIESIDSIEDSQAKKSFKKWLEAIERGEKYFSNSIVKLIEKDIPSKEFLEDEKYSAITAQLEKRSEALIYAGKEYSHVYNILIKKAYATVIEFEKNPNDVTKANAKKAIGDVYSKGNGDILMTILNARVDNLKY